MVHGPGNAERLTAMYGADLRYCHAFKKWLWFDGQRWRVDEIGHSRDLAKLTMVEFLRQAVAASIEQRSGRELDLTYHTAQADLDKIAETNAQIAGRSSSPSDTSRGAHN